MKERLIAWPYILYKIITWPTNGMIILFEKWHYWLWTLAHYKFGNGPKF